MITLQLYGKLGRVYGKEWKLEARSLAEALHAIETMKGGFYDLIMELEATVQGYHVQADDATIGKELLDFPCGEVYQLTPILKGSDTKGILQIVAGVALIAIGSLATYGAFGAVAAGIATTGIGGATIGGFAVAIGLSLALGGVARLLTTAPSQTTGSPTANKPSYIFTGPINTTQQGECVPVAYGLPITGSAVVLAGIETEVIFDKYQT